MARFLGAGENETTANFYLRLLLCRRFRGTLREGLRGVVVGLRLSHCSLEPEL